ncbi:hypothetical protein [Streptomyces sp. NPDC001594]|uniref:hypothetical protein n=1 Tax=Streptomyces sp. NPDC001594 TaxID=3364590 RepID=UPI0036BB6464
MGDHLIVIGKPSPTGGRRVRVDGEILGLAHGVSDVLEFLRRAGLEWDEADLLSSGLVEWKGGGPTEWPESPS